MGEKYLSKIETFNDTILKFKNSNKFIKIQKKKNLLNDYKDLYDTLKEKKVNSANKTLVNNFLEDYENINTIIREINEDYMICEFKENPHLFDDIFNIIHSKRYIKPKYSKKIKDKYNNFFNFFNKYDKEKLSLNEKSKIEMFLKEYKTLDSTIRHVNKTIGNKKKRRSSQIKQQKTETKFLNRYKNIIYQFNEEIWNLKESSKIISVTEIKSLKEKFKAVFDVIIPYVNDSKYNVDFEIIEFTKDYSNLDITIKDINHNIQRTEILEKLNQHVPEAIEFNNEINDLKNSKTFINYTKQEYLKNKYVNLFNLIENSQVRFDLDLDEELLSFIEDYKDIESIIRDINKKVDTKNLVEKINSNKSEALKFNNKINTIILLKGYPDNITRNKLKNEYKNLFNYTYPFTIDYNFDLDNEIKLFLKNYNDLDKKFDNAKHEYIKKEINENKTFFDNIEGKSLDFSQRKAVVVDEVNTEIIAGAGSGKTLTILAKVKYLIEKKGINPENILCMSYSNSSVEELIERLPSNVFAFTFHKLGGFILSDNNEVSSCNDNALEDYMKKYFKEKVINNHDLSLKILKFYGYYFYNPTPEEKLSNKGKLLDKEKGRDYHTLRAKYGETKDKITLNYEKVRSLEELIIANFLFLNGIDYEYEKKYLSQKKFQDYKNFLKKFLFKEFGKDLIPDCIKEDLINQIIKISPLKYHPTKYKPDFYLPKYDIYLEHFGVDKNCQALWLSETKSQKYYKDMLWKRDVHQAYGTKLLETYSYYMKENRLLKRLKEKLLKENVEFNKLDYTEIVNRLIERRKVNKFYYFTNLLITFIELFKGNNYQYNKFKEFKHINETYFNGFNQERNKIFLDLVEDIYIGYEKFLKEKEEIDFNDMINNATKLVKQSKFKDHYDYIIIDEYQDTSHTRYKLIKSIQNQIKCKVCVVGDDWQSIYRFTGCDIGLFTNFNKYFKNPEILYLENVYRNSNQLIDISSNFIKKNRFQIRKVLKSKKNLTKPVKIAEYNRTVNKEKVKFFEYLINKCGENSKNILVLGRNNQDITSYIDKTIFHEKRNENKITGLTYLENPDLNIKYSTMHSSKGSEEDNVIIINLEDKITGFPNQKVDDPVLNFLTTNSDNYEFAEERRLFYVALTRTKNYVYLLVPKDNESSFITELTQHKKLLDIIPKKDIKEYFKGYDWDSINLNYNNESINIPTRLKCPECETGNVILNNTYKDGEIKYSNFRCSYERCTWEGGYYSSDLNFLDLIEICPECEGILQIKQKNNHYFKGCTHYSKDSQSSCNKTKQLQRRDKIKLNKILNPNKKKK